MSIDKAIKRLILKLGKIEGTMNMNCNIMRHIVAQLVDALRYKPERRGFDTLWCQWDFSLTWSFRPHCGPGVDSTTNRNEYQEYFLGGKGSRCVGLTTLPPSCADCLEIWETQPTGILWACPAIVYSYLLQVHNIVCLELAWRLGCHTEGGSTGN